MEIESTPEKSSVADAVAFDLKTHKASKSIGVSMRAQVAIAKITQTDARLVWKLSALFALSSLLTAIV